MRPQSVDQLVVAVVVAVAADVVVVAAAALAAVFRCLSLIFHWHPQSAVRLLRVAVAAGGAGGAGAAGAAVAAVAAVGAVAAVAVPAAVLRCLSLNFHCLCTAFRSHRCAADPIGGDVHHCLAQCLAVARPLVF